MMSSTRSEAFGFNPRAREGRDIVDRQIVRRSVSFNPRAREGRDWVCWSFS